MAAMLFVCTMRWQCLAVPGGAWRWPASGTLPVQGPNATANIPTACLAAHPRQEVGPPSPMLQPPRTLAQYIRREERLCMCRLQPRPSIDVWASASTCSLSTLADLDSSSVNRHQRRVCRMVETQLRHPDRHRPGARLRLLGPTAKYR